MTIIVQPLKDSHRFKSLRICSIQYLNEERCIEYNYRFLQDPN